MPHCSLNCFEQSSFEHFHFLQMQLAFLMVWHFYPRILNCLRSSFGQMKQILCLIHLYETFNEFSCYFINPSKFIRFDFFLLSFYSGLYLEVVNFENFEYWFRFMLCLDFMIYIFEEYSLHFCFHNFVFALKLNLIYF